MCDKIGKVRPDGSVLFITLNYNVNFDRNKSTLLRFYTPEKRLDALLALGNLVVLAPSPYNKHKGYDCDPGNCRAEIRDDFESKRKHQAKVSASAEEFAQVYGAAYLWDGGTWYYVSVAERTPLKEKSPVGAGKESFLKELKCKVIHEQGGMETLRDFNAKSWEEAAARASQDGRSLYFFRDSKLIKVIHPQTQTA